MTFKNIHVGKQVWTYSIGRLNIVIKHPEGSTPKKTIARIETVTGRPISRIAKEAGHELKRIAVLPSQVKEFIEKNLTTVKTRNSKT